MWCRRSMPLRGSIERRSAGNTYCQPQSRDAAGYLRSSANGPDGAASFQQVHRVQPLRLPQLAAQQANETIGQHRDAILGAFPVAHQDFPALEVDIFDPQSDRFHDPHARAVQQFREEPVVAPEASLAASDRVSTVGKRVGAFARTTPSSQGNSRTRTCR